MNLKKIDKKIINFTYNYQQEPGFTKRKSLLHNLQIDETELDQSIDKLILNKLIIITDKKTSHAGICYEITEKGVEKWNELNKTVLEKINLNIKKISIIAIIGFLISFFLELFSDEIKTWLLKIFN